MILSYILEKRDDSVFFAFYEYCRADPSSFCIDQSSFLFVLDRNVASSGYLFSVLLISKKSVAVREHRGAMSCALVSSLHPDYSLPRPNCVYCPMK